MQNDHTQLIFCHLGRSCFQSNQQNTGIVQQIIKRFTILYKLQIEKQSGVISIMIDHYNIPIEDLMAIEVQMSNKAAFDALAKSFQYDDNKSLNQNLKLLSETVSSFLRLDGRVKTCFVDYFVQKNIPIEVTFKPLRADQLQNIIEEWLSLHTESSTIIEKLYSNNHRNILFKRVLFEERQMIDDYFKTLSQKSMLRGVDLYQLLVDILSPFQLYEYNIDSETFFEKVNSLNSFLAVVSRFIHSEKRISVGINSQDVEYIRRFEFDRLIQFWEGQNPELILLSERRKNHLDKETQTLEGNAQEQAAQTERICLSLPEIINQTLKSLNKLTPDNNSVQELESIERIYSFLRKEKILQLQERQHHPHLQDHSDELLEKTSQRTQKKVQSPSSETNAFSAKNKTQAGMLVSLLDHINQNQTVGSIDQEISHQQFQTSKIHPSHFSKQKQKITKQLAQTLHSIYNIYFSTKFGIEQLDKCLDDIGVARTDIQGAIEKLLSVNRHDKNYVYYHQFEKVVQDLMVRDPNLTDKVLDEFLKAKLDELTTPSYASSLSRRRYHGGFATTYFRY